MAFTIQLEKDHYVVSFIYSEEHVEAIKTIGSGIFDRQKRQWIFPRNETIRKKLMNLAQWDQIIWMDGPGGKGIVTPKPLSNEAGIRKKIGIHVLRYYLATHSRDTPN